MSDHRGLRSGHLVALAGACLALGSLWAPWYRVDLGAIQGALQQRAGLAGTPAGDFMQSLMALLPRSISGDAWQTLHDTDVLVAFASVAAIAALLAAGGSFGPGIRVSRDAASRLSAGAGAICALFVGGRAMNPPGPNVYIDVRWGAWACLIGCAAMAAGGVAASSARRQSRAGDWSSQADFR
jgi:hypothetical protein